MLTALLLLFACVATSEGTGDTANGDTASAATAQLWDWGDGVPSCNWFYAAGPLGAHSLYVADLTLPQADFDAGVDVSYDRNLSPGELVLWYDDATTDTAELYVCNDNVPTIVGRRVSAVAGRITLDAVATGPDEECGSPQTYSVTWTITGIQTADGPIDDMGPNEGAAGFFGNCYG